VFTGLSGAPEDCGAMSGSQQARSNHDIGAPRHPVLQSGHCRDMGARGIRGKPRQPGISQRGTLLATERIIRSSPTSETTMSTSPLFSALEGKLLSPTFSGPTQKADRYGFRGELGLRFPPSVAGEKRPPEIKADQVILAAEGEQVVFLTLHVASLAHLDLIRETFGSALTPAGKYFIFAGNVDIAKKYQLDLDGITFYVLPLDEATVYNEILDLFYLEKGDLKKLGNDGKIDTIVAAAASSRGGFPVTPYSQALAEMGPIKVVENRPV